MKDTNDKFNFNIFLKYIFLNLDFLIFIFYNSSINYYKNNIFYINTLIINKMNKMTIVSVFFIIFILFETLFYYLYKNKNAIKESFLIQQPTQPTQPTQPKKNSIKEPFLEGYQGSETNYESCKKSGYPHQWCLHIQEPYGIPNPDSLIECAHNYSRK
jgi:hypothetical protein